MLELYKNSPVPSCCGPHYESEAKCKALHIKITFVYMSMKTNFHNKKFALSLAFIMRFKATQKWPIANFFPQTWQQTTSFRRSSLFLEGGRERTLGTRLAKRDTLIIAVTPRELLLGGALIC